MRKFILPTLFGFLFTIPLLASEAIITLNDGSKIIVNDPNRDCATMRRMLDSKYGGHYNFVVDWECAINNQNEDNNPNINTPIILIIHLLEGQNPLDIQNENLELIHMMSNNGEYEVIVQFAHT